MPDDSGQPRGVLDETWLQDLKFCSGWMGKGRTDSGIVGTSDRSTCWHRTFQLHFCFHSRLANSVYWYTKQVNIQRRFYRTETCLYWQLQRRETGCCPFACLRYQPTQTDLGIPESFPSSARLLQSWVLMVNISSLNSPFSMQSTFRVWLEGGERSRAPQLNSHTHTHLMPPSLWLLEEGAQRWGTGTGTRTQCRV